MKIFTNRKAGCCYQCGAPVPVGDGFAFSHTGAWGSYAAVCRSTQCLAAEPEVLERVKALAEPRRRVLEPLPDSNMLEAQPAGKAARDYTLAVAQCILSRYHRQLGASYPELFTK